MVGLFLFIFEFLSFVFKFFFYSPASIYAENMVLRYQLNIAKRRLKQRKARLNLKKIDKLFFILLHNISDISEYVSLFTPRTLLKWKRQFVKRLWTYPKKKRGRPPVSEETKKLILKMKNENNLGSGQIRGELLKLGIDIKARTIRKILQNFRKRGKIKSSLTWSQFLKSHIKSIYAMDFFTVDTFLNMRFYVHFIIHHDTRRIVQFSITTNPIREFVRQQIIDFEEKVNTAVYLIHDNFRSFFLDYEDYNIKSIRTSPYAPNMNAIAERFVGSIRREALDYFFIFSQRQLYNIVKEYVEYYNNLRPHQGIKNDTPNGYTPQKKGQIKTKPILGGIRMHYYREMTPKLTDAA